MSKMLSLRTVVSTSKSDVKLVIIGRISEQKEYQYVCQNSRRSYRCVRI